VRPIRSKNIISGKNQFSAVADGKRLINWELFIKIYISKETEYSLHFQKLVVITREVLNCSGHVGSVRLERRI